MHCSDNTVLNLHLSFQIEVYLNTPMNNDIHISQAKTLFTFSASCSHARQHVWSIGHVSSVTLGLQVSN